MQAGESQGTKNVRITATIPNDASQGDYSTTVLYTFAYDIKTTSQTSTLHYTVAGSQLLPTNVPDWITISLLAVIGLMIGYSVTRKH